MEKAEFMGELILILAIKEITTRCRNFKPSTQNFKLKSMIKATIHYWENGVHHQKQVLAQTEEKLMHDTFMFKVEQFSSPRAIEISYIDYNGSQLQWNEFAAHQHFAKGRISFAEFKEMCYEPNTLTFQPETLN